MRLDVRPDGQVRAGRVEELGADQIAHASTQTRSPLIHHDAAQAGHDDGDALSFLTAELLAPNSCEQVAVLGRRCACVPRLRLPALRPCSGWATWRTGTLQPLCMHGRRHASACSPTRACMRAFPNRRVVWAASGSVRKCLTLQSEVVQQVCERGERGEGHACPCQCWQVVASGAAAVVVLGWCEWPAQPMHRTFSCTMPPPPASYVNGSPCTVHSAPALKAGGVGRLPGLWPPRCAVPPSADVRHHVLAGGRAAGGVGVDSVACAWPWSWSGLDVSAPRPRAQDVCACRSSGGAPCINPYQPHTRCRRTPLWPALWKRCGHARRDCCWGWVQGCWVRTWPPQHRRNIEAGPFRFPSLVTQFRTWPQGLDPIILPTPSMLCARTSPRHPPPCLGALPARSPHSDGSFACPRSAVPPRPCIRRAPGRASPLSVPQPTNHLRQCPPAHARAVPPCVGRAPGHAPPGRPPPRAGGCVAARGVRGLLRRVEWGAGGVGLTHAALCGHLQRGAPCAAAACRHLPSSRPLQAA